MTRRRVAVLVLVLWAAGLAALARRTWYQPSGARLAIAAQEVAPGAAYFVVEREGRPVGFASSVLDTTLAGVRIVDMLVTGVRGAAGNVTLRASTELTRSLVPVRYEARLRGGPIPLELHAEADGDSAVRLRVSSGDGEATPQRVATRGPALSPSAVPLVFAHGDQRRVDGRVALTVLDPLEMRARDVVFRVTAESLFVVSDSAAFDSTAGRWVSARRDTLRAWRLEPEGGSADSAFGGWVDAAGRFVDASYGGGYRLRRTSYEEAALNWRRARGDSAPPPPAPAGTP